MRFLAPSPFSPLKNKCGEFFFEPVVVEIVLVSGVLKNVAVLFFAGFFSSFEIFFPPFFFYFRIHFFVENFTPSSRYRIDFAAFVLFLFDRWFFDGNFFIACVLGSPAAASREILSVSTNYSKIQNFFWAGGAGEGPGMETMTPPEK